MTAIIKELTLYAIGSVISFSYVSSGVIFKLVAVLNDGHAPYPSELEQ